MRSYWRGRRSWQSWWSVTRALCTLRASRQQQRSRRQGLGGRKLTAAQLSGLNPTLGPCCRRWRTRWWRCACAAPRRSTPTPPRGEPRPSRGPLLPGLCDIFSSALLCSRATTSSGLMLAGWTGGGIFLLFASVAPAPPRAPSLRRVDEGSHLDPSDQHVYLANCLHALQAPLVGHACAAQHAQQLRCELGAWLLVAAMLAWLSRSRGGLCLGPGRAMRGAAAPPTPFHSSPPHASAAVRCWRSVCSC